MDVAFFDFFPQFIVYKTTFRLVYEIHFWRLDGSLDGLLDFPQI